MPDTRHGIDPAGKCAADFESGNPLRPDCVRIAGTTRRGKPCELVDNSGDALPRAALDEILDTLIRENRFGFGTATAAGGTTLDLARREGAHIQVAGKLYRLILYRYQARIEPF
jgi:hypothetical protein